MNKPTKKGFDVPKGFPIPLNRSVIIEKQNLEAKTKGGLILNEGAEDNNVGIIMAAAPDCYAQLAPGQKVMFSNMEKRTIMFDGNTYLIMHEQSVFCILPENAILMVQSTDANVKRKQEKIDAEPKRRAAVALQEENMVDKINERAKKKFGTRKKK